MDDRPVRQFPDVSISHSFAPVVGDYAHIENHFHLPGGTWTNQITPPPLISSQGMITSPYRGLSPFGEEDEGLFFGRDTATTDVLTLISRRLAGTGLLVVSGVSGAGKSSLLYAGVLPRLRQHGLEQAPYAASWPRLVLTPGSRPLRALAAQAARPAGADANAILAGLIVNPAGFTLTARQATLTPQDHTGAPRQPGGAAQRRLVLVVDQFEQLFTQCKDEGERQAFITALASAASQDSGWQHPAAIVVIAVRSDFEARLAEYPQLVTAVQDRYMLTGMTDRQLQLAIARPAAAAGSSVDNDLMQVLLSEIHTRSRTGGGSPGPTALRAGVLPLLSHALDQGWRSRTGQTLTLADYERAGGIDGAVASSAQSAYESLSPAQQTAAQQVFIRLTATSTDGVNTAARATRADLTAGKNIDHAHDVDSVLEEFAGRRLLTLGADSVEISHEALLTAWPLLRDDWLAQTQADRIVRTRLHNTAAEWAARSHDPSYLYSGSLRHAAAETAARITADPARHVPLNQDEHDFLAASDHAHQGRIRRRRAVIAGLLALTLTALTAAGGAAHYAVNARQQAANASRQHHIALSRQLVTDSISLASTDPVTARQLALAAWHAYPTDQAWSTMTTLLTGQQHDGDIPVDAAAMAFSPNSQLLATADRDGYVRLWDPETSRPVGHPLLAGHGQYDGAHAVAFSPDSKLLATAGGDGYIRLCNPTTGRQIGPPMRASQTPGTGATAVAFSPGGTLLASAAQDGYIRLWNPATGTPAGKPILADPGAQSGVTAVAFSPSGALLASAGVHGDVQLWDPATGTRVGEPLTAVTGLHGTVLGVAFSPDGKLLASAGSDGYVRLWDPASGRQIRRLLAASPGQGTGAAGVAFSPDGTRLATAGSDGYLRLWDPASGRQIGGPVRAVWGQGGSVDAMAYSPRGTLLATAGNDGYVRLWNPVTGAQARKPLKADPGPYSSGSVNAVAFSPDGKLLATAADDGYVLLWNLATGRQVTRPMLAASDQGHDIGPTGVAFSPDGKLLASAGSDGRVLLWNPATGRQIGPALIADTPSGSMVDGVVFSPDGRLLASGYDGGTIQLWAPASGMRIGPSFLADQGEGATVAGLAFSPDSKLLASAGSDYIRLWNPATGRQTRRPLHAVPGQSVSTGGVAGVAFSPDGKLLASQAGGDVRLWNLAAGTQIGATMPDTHSQGVMAGVAFSPDGSVVAEADGSSWETWQLRLNLNPYQALCTDVGPLSTSQWKHYAPGEPQPDLCAEHSNEAL